jgi:hypothetical protein
MRTVKFIEKSVTVRNEKTDKDEQFIEYYKVGEKTYKAGDSAEITDKHAIWLAAHGFIDPIRKVKEDKKAAARETK